MSALIYVEELDRAGRVERRQRVAATSLTLGRGYEVDVILDDPLVAASHLRVELIEGGRLRVHAIDPTHPCRIAGRWGDGGEIDQDGIVQIGHSRLRFRTADYQVAAAPRRRMRDWLQLFDLKWLDWALLVIVISSVGLEHWLTVTDTRGAGPLILAMATMAVMMLGWSGLWSLLSRLLVKHFEFHRHLALSGAALVCLQLTDWLLEPLCHVWLPGWCLPAAVAAIGAGWAFGHLRLCAHGDRGPIALVSLLALAGSGLWGLEKYNELHRYNPSIPADIRIAPLPANLLPTESSEAFFARAKQLKDEADEAAKALD